MNPLGLQSLLEDAEALAKSPEHRDPGLLAQLARRALSLGHPLLACEWLLSRRALCERDPELRYLLALAEVRIGGYREARRCLRPLLEGPISDSRRIGQGPSLRVDTLSLAGRIAKDAWQRLPNGPERDQALVEAVSLYLEAWEESRDPFPGINAASLLYLRSEGEAAKQLAAAVERRIQEAPQETQDHWRAAMLGEAALLLGKADSAKAHYAEAARLAGSRLGDMAAMRRQLQLLLPTLPAADAALGMLPMPAVLAFTGHMLDPSGAEASRFPASLESSVAEAINQRIGALNAGIGYCSAASGADILFIEAMLERDAEVHVTLPFARDDFIATSLAPAGQEWIERFESAMRRVSSITFGVPERYLGDEALFAYAGTLIQGAARLRAETLGMEPTLLAVVDPASTGGEGGTRETLMHWQSAGLPVDWIDLAVLRGSPFRETRPSADGSKLLSTPQRLHREVRSMLFADVVGYSRLAEEHTPAYLLAFLARVAELVDGLNPTPELVNTWGDGLFLVFRDVTRAARFALALRDMVTAVDWPAEGLPNGIHLRIGLHVGPVYPAEDPLLQRPNVFGTQVTRAARIEPVAAADSVFISAEAAFALAADGIDDLRADYLGTLPLAKGYGSQPMYRLRRASDMG